MEKRIQICENTDSRKIRIVCTERPSKIRPTGKTLVENNHLPAVVKRSKTEICVSRTQISDQNDRKYCRLLQPTITSMTEKRRSNTKSSPSAEVNLRKKSLLGGVLIKHSTPSYGDPRQGGGNIPPNLKVGRGQPFVSNSLHSASGVNRDSVRHHSGSDRHPGDPLVVRLASRGTRVNRESYGRIRVTLMDIANHIPHQLRAAPRTLPQEGRPTLTDQSGSANKQIEVALTDTRLLPSRPTFVELRQTKNQTIKGNLQRTQAWITRDLSSVKDLSTISNFCSENKTTLILHWLHATSKLKKTPSEDKSKKTAWNV